MILLGQAVVATRYNRRLEVMDTVTKNFKESKSLLSLHDKELKDPQLLFGTQFLEKVEKEEGKKTEDKGLFSLAPPTKRRRFSSPPSQYRADRASSSFAMQKERRPFQGGSRQGEGAYRDPKRRGGFRGKGRGDKYPRYVLLSSSTTTRTQPKQNKPHTRTVMLSTINKPKHSTDTTKPDSTTMGQNTHRGQNKKGLTKLGKTNTGSKYPKHGKRLFDTIQSDTEPHTTIQPKILRVRSHPNNTGSRHDDSERSDKTSDPTDRSICRPHLFEREERRRTEASFQSQETEWFCGIQALQDGRATNDKNSTTRERLDDKTGPQRCILLCSNESKSQEIPEVQMERKPLRVPMPTIRPGISTQGLHKTSQASDRLAKTTRYQTIDLPRRHSCDEPTEAQATTRWQNNSKPPRTLGVHHQHTEVDTNSDKETRVLGNDDQFGRIENEPSGTENRSSDEEMSKPPDKSCLHDPRASRTDRNAISDNDGDSASSPTIQTSANAENEGVDEITLLQQHHSADTTLQARTQMVAITPQRSEWQIDHSNQPGFGDRNRCQPARLGSYHGYSVSERTLDRGRETRTHQRTGTESSVVSTTSIHQGDTVQTHTHQNRQCLNSVSHQQEGRNKVNQTGDHYQRSMELLSQEEDHNHCRIPAGQQQYHSRLIIKRDAGLERLEIEPDSVQHDQCSSRTMPDRPICHQNEQTIAKVHKLENRPGGSAKRRLDDIVERATRICFPTILPDRPMPGENKERRNTTGSDNTSMANTTMVRSNTTTHNDNATTPAKRQDPAEIAIRSESPIDGKWHPPTDGMEDFRKRKRLQGLSEEAADLATKAWRKGTRSAYNSAWAKWSSWCTERSIDPVSCSVNKIADFLTGMFWDGYQYNTINLHRSAISALHDEVDGTPIGQNQLIKKILTGVFQENPPKPKYTTTWDVNVVLQHIKNLGPNDTLSDDTLTHKLAMLIALTTASRASEIQAMTLEHMSDKDNEITFTLPQHTKTTKVGQKPHTITLQSFQETELDVVTCCRAYIGRTFHWRKTETQHQLLLGTVSPHNPIKSCTVANWLKRIMQAAGLDTEMFKAHSTRAASTSKAKMEGLSVTDILQQANWSRAGTFTRFYCRETKDNNFANKVLNM